jgi:hypothetical protein
MQHLPGYRYLFARSHFLTFIKHRIANLAHAKHASEHRDPAAIEAGKRRAYELTERLFYALDEKCSQMDCQLIVTAVPRQTGESQREWVMNLIAAMKQREIPYLDLDLRFNDETRHGIENYIPEDGHWNSRGHRLAAELIYEFMASHPGILSG